MVTADHRLQAEGRKLRNQSTPLGLSDYPNLGIEPSQASSSTSQTAYFEQYKGVRTFIDQTFEEPRREQKSKR